MKIVLFAIAILFIIGAVFWLFFGGPLSVIPKQEVNGKVVERVVVVESIIEDPVVFDGLTVEVRNQVSDWVSKKSFRLGKPAGFLGSTSDGLLVIRDKDFKLPGNSSEKELALGEEGSRVLVKGKVRILTREQVAEMLGVDLEKTDIGRFKETPVIIAEKVERIK